LTDAQPGPPLATVALRGVCPRCGEGRLFAGLTGFVDRCVACGLDFSTFNVGDGPAAFLTFGIGAVVTALAITLELTLHPPLWVHMLIWVPVIGGGVVWSLRLAKAALLAAEYRNAAREGRIVP
jgi:uncharacterized protein (DUF983 family)